MPTHEIVDERGDIVPPINESRYGDAVAGKKANEGLKVSGDRLAKQFESLEYKGSSDQQLIELKQRMGLVGPGQAQPTHQLNKGNNDVHDAELVEEGDEGSTR